MEVGDHNAPDEIANIHSVAFPISRGNQIQLYTLYPQNPLLPTAINS